MLEHFNNTHIIVDSSGNAYSRKAEVKRRFNDADVISSFFNFVTRKFPINDVATAFDNVEDPFFIEAKKQFIKRAKEVKKDSIELVLRLVKRMFIKQRRTEERRNTRIFSQLVGFQPLSDGESDDELVENVRRMPMVPYDDPNDKVDKKLHDEIETEITRYLSYNTGSWIDFLEKPVNHNLTLKSKYPDCEHFQPVGELNHLFWHVHLRGQCSLLFKALETIGNFFVSNSETERGFNGFTRVCFKLQSRAHNFLCKIVNPKIVNFVGTWLTSLNLLFYYLGLEVWLMWF